MNQTQDLQILPLRLNSLPLELLLEEEEQGEEVEVEEEEEVGNERARHKNDKY